MRLPETKDELRRMITLIRRYFLAEIVYVELSDSQLDV